MKEMKRLFAILLLSVAAACSHPEKKGSTGTDSWSFGPFLKADSLNPILLPDSGQVFVCPVTAKQTHWESRNVLNPTAVVRAGKVYLLYRAQDAEMTSRIGLAISEDGLHFTKQPAPVFYPDKDSMNTLEWKGGVEDPRIVEDAAGKYILTYTSYDGKTARLCLASSTDLIHWQKHGPVLGTGKYRDTWSKSGAIVVKQQGEKMIAERINGKYWMYWGDTNLFLAASDDCIHWSVMEESGKPKPVLQPRPGKFDSRLVESGPYAILTQAGILLLYNGMNLDTGGDPALPAGAYCSGQALFDAKDPSIIMSRMDGYFMKPDKPYEQTGQVNQVCFIEGMVPFKGNWLLYYGTADSKIAVASSPLK